MIPRPWRDRRAAGLGTLAERMRNDSPFELVSSGLFIEVTLFQRDAAERSPAHMAPHDMW